MVFRRAWKKSKNRPPPWLLPIKSSTDVTWTEQSLDLPTDGDPRHASKYKEHKLHQSTFRVKSAKENTFRYLLGMPGGVTVDNLGL